MVEELHEIDETESKIYDEGYVLLLVGGVSHDRMDRWVKRVADACGEPVTWHAYAGYQVVKAIGNLSKVESTIEDYLPRLRPYTEPNREYRRGGKYHWTIHYN